MNLQAMDKQIKQLRADIRKAKKEHKPTKEMEARIVKLQQDIIAENFGRAFAKMMKL